VLEGLLAVQEQQVCSLPACSLQTLTQSFSISYYFDIPFTLPSRFLTAEGTSKNRIIGPSRILHFYNAPPDATEESLKDIFAKSGAILPKGIKFFSQGGKSATGLMEWDTIEESLETFVVATHTTVQSSGEY